MNIEDVKRFGSAIGEWVSAGAPIVAETEQQNRLNTCLACDKFDGSRCTLCNCFMGVKTWLGTSQCPLNKWTDASPARWFFERAENATKLRNELPTWRGTRFFPQAAPAVKGVRADCVSFVEGVLVAVGAIKPIQWPAYVTRAGGVAMRQLMLSTIGTVPEFLRVHPTEVPLSPVIGDVFVVSSGKALHHMAIFAGENTIWHATQDGGGVCTGNANDPSIVKHLIAVYRVR